VVLELIGFRIRSLWSERRRTELTSGAPPGPERPRSVLEALEGARAGINGVAARAHVAYRRRIRVDGITTTTAEVSMFDLRADPGFYVPTTVSFHCRDSHCLEFATAADCEGLGRVRVGQKVP
jgi:hypothetical protein